MQYQYCGPGTDIEKRLARNDSGINPLDGLCKEHDIAYTKTTDAKERNKADKVLAKKAWQRAKSSKAKLSERVASAAVAAVMAVKSKLGMGLKRKKKKSNYSRKRKPIQRKKRRGNGIRGQRRRRRRGSKSKKRTSRKKKKLTISPKQQKITVKKLYNQAVLHAKHVIAAKKPKPLKNAVIVARDAAQKIIEKNKTTLSKSEIKNNLPRIIPIPKQEGGAISVFGALSALGAIMGGTAGIVNAITSTKDARKMYDESKRHNETMEAIAIGKKPKNGSGLFLGPHPRKNGLGLFLNTNVNDNNNNNVDDNVPKN